MIRLFPYLVAVLEGAACVVYLLNREYRMAVIWFGYTIAACALAAVK